MTLRDFLLGLDNRKSSDFRLYVRRSHEGAIGDCDDYEVVQHTELDQGEFIFVGSLDQLCFDEGKEPDALSYVISSAPYPVKCGVHDLSKRIFVVGRSRFVVNEDSLICLYGERGLPYRLQDFLECEVAKIVRAWTEEAVDAFLESFSAD